MIFKRRTLVTGTKCTLPRVVSLVLSLCLVLMMSSETTAQTLVNLSLTADVDLSGNDPTAMPTCTPFNYNLNYGVVSLEDDAVNTTISFPLNGLEYVGFINNSDVASVDVVGTDLIVTFVSPLVAGSSGTATVQLQFPCGETCTADITGLTAEMNADNAGNGPLASTDIELTSLSNGNNSYLNINDFDVNYDAQTLKFDIDLDNSTQTIYDNNLKNITFSLTVPTGATIAYCGREQVAGTDPIATCSQTGDVITWTLADVPHDYNPSGGINDAVINLPPSYVEGDVVNLTSTATATLGNSCGDWTDTHAVSYTLPAIIVDIDCSSHKITGLNSDNDAMMVGMERLEYKNSIRNDGNITLYDVCAIIDIPFNYIDNIRDLEVDDYSGIGFGDLIPLPDVTISYATNLDPTFTVGGVVNAEDVDIPDPVLAAGEYITQVQYCTDFLPPNSYFRIEFRYDILLTPRDGSTYSPMTYADYEAAGCASNETATCPCPDGISCLEFTTHYMANDSNGGTEIINELGCTTGKPIVEYTVTLKDEVKAVINASGVILPGDTITYEIQFAPNDVQEDVVDLVITDTLDTNLQYIGNMVYNNQTGVPNPTFIQNGQVLIWDWSANPTPDNIISSATSTNSNSHLATIQFDVVVKPGTLPGNLENCFAIVSAGELPVGMSPSNSPCEVFNIPTTTNLLTTKWVKGSLDQQYSKFPDVGQTVPGEIYTYRFVVINTGNVTLQDINLMDILPFVGDQAVSADFARLSEWTPTAASDVFFLENINADPTVCDNFMVAQPADVTVQYSTETNPCRSDLQPAYNPAGCTGPTWSATAPANTADIKSFLVNIGGPFLPGDTMVFAIEMIAPESANPGEITWNSFAQQAQRADNLDVLPIAEPNKVGVTVPAVLDVALKKELSSTTPEPLLPGNSVTFDIWVYNQGSVLAENIQISDYIPAGLLLNDTDWSETGGIATLNTPIASIAVADSVMVSIDFTIDANYADTTIINYAEISAVSGTNPIDASALTDIDSTPNQNNTDDAGGQVETEADNYVDGNGTGVIGDGVADTDEDDHDPALINITIITCTNPTATAYALAASCTNGVPNDDGYLQISAASDATHYNFVMGSDYTAGDADIANATAFDPATDLPLQFGALANPIGSQDYTIRIFNGASDCFTDVVVTLNETVLPTLTIDGAACDANLTTYTIDFTSDGTVTSDVGTVSGNQVTGVPVGTDANLTADLNGCTTTAVVTAPDCSCTPNLCLPVTITKQE